MLLALIVVLAGISVYLNQDWFAKDVIQISHRSRPARATFFRRKRPDSSLVNPVMFGFDRKVKLTSVAVIPLSDLQTNKYPQAIWHLVSDSNSVPTKTFYYGEAIRGMRPEVKGATAEPLEPGVPYRLFIAAATFKGEHDFTAEPKNR